MMLLLSCYCSYRCFHLCTHISWQRGILEAFTFRLTRIKSFVTHLNPFELHSWVDEIAYNILELDVISNRKLEKEEKEEKNMREHFQLDPQRIRKEKKWKQWHLCDGG